VEFTAKDSTPTDIQSGSAGRSIELYLKPEIIDAMRLAWTRAGAGVSRSEAGFYVASDGSKTDVDRTNQDVALRFTIPAGTTAIFHTHPRGHDRMSQQDMAVADKANLDMYVISRSGLYHYRPGMKRPEMLQAGIDYLTKKKGSK
jgi:hypothetical protein